MPGSCCSKPISKTIKVGMSEAGVLGLEEMFGRVYTSGMTNDKEVKAELLALARDFGNYIAPGVEEDYKDALLHEFRHFRKQQEQGAQSTKK